MQRIASFTSCVRVKTTSGELNTHASQLYISMRVIATSITYRIVRWCSLTRFGTLQAERATGSVLLAPALCTCQTDGWQGIGCQDRFWRAGAQAKDDDYHGNFNAPNFEHWLRDLCARFCFRWVLLHLHGGRLVSQEATQSIAHWKNQEGDIQEWLLANNILYDDSATKPLLPELVRFHKPPPIYAAIEIARPYGHELQYTPPYNPEL